MKKFMFAAAAALLSASVATADDKPATAGQVQGGTAVAPVVTGTTLPTTGPTVYSSTSSTGRRMGLLARLRARGSSGTVMSAPMAPATTVTMPSTGSTGTTGTGSSVPSPMPTTSAGPAVTGQPVVVAGGPMTSDGMVMPAGGRMMRNGRVMQTGGMTMMNTGTAQPACCGGDTQTAMAAPMMTTSNQRMGLIARMRAR